MYVFIYVSPHHWRTFLGLGRLGFLVAKYLNLHESTQRSNKLPASNSNLQLPVPESSSKWTKFQACLGQLQCSPPKNHWLQTDEGYFSPRGSETGSQGAARECDLPQRSVAKLGVTQSLMQIAKVMAFECFGYCSISIASLSQYKK